MPQVDYRARLQPKSQMKSYDILGPNESSNILYPLHSTHGVLFPYTPAISSGYEAKYDQSAFIHSNYSYNAYISSTPKPISITTEFTAQTEEEALYMLAVIHFFRAITKSYFGINPYNKAGTPPPTLLFNYLGEYQFNNVPVVVKSFDYTYDATVDYVPVSTTNLGYGASAIVENRRINLSRGNSNGYTYVPTHLAISIELETQYIPIKLRNEFNLDDFRSGRLIGKGYI